mgnify:FL=1
MNTRLQIILLSVIFCFSCSENEIINENSVDLSLAEKTDVDFSNRILDAINIYRNSVDLSPIDLDLSYASALAVNHTLYMINENRISHDNFYERSLALIQSPEISVVAENVARGYTSAEDVVKAWLSSPSHKKNIEGDYTHLGMGIIQNEEGIYYFTQLFYR